MSEQFIVSLMIGAAALFFIIVIAYVVLNKMMQKSEYRQIQQLREGTKENTFSAEVIYQKLFIIYKKVPFLKRYVRKLRRRLEIINIEDEYLTRLQTSKIITNSLLVILPITLVVIMFTKQNILLMSILLIFEVFFLETIVDGMVDKIDNKLLKQQIDLFAEVRHAYHEYNMVEEAIYQVAQDDELEVSRQAQKIYEILISDDPEMELEKYYDIAPNSYLKEFAGVSYLTKEFGDRKIDKASLYLKNLNNITQEMQLEILKRDKLDYVFQSLSMIAAIPILFIEPVKNWALSQFSFTSDFYNGKLGFIVQVLLILITFISYLLTRKLKDNGGIKDAYVDPNQTWQAKAYKNPIIKRIVDLFIPKAGTKEHRKITKLLKEAASKLKIEWLYINRITICVTAFVISIFFFQQLHNTAIDLIYTTPEADFNIVGQMSEHDEKRAMEKTERDNYFINKFKGDTSVTVEKIATHMKYSDYYEDATEEEIKESSERVFTKLQVVNKEYLQWFELLLSFLFAAIGYYGPIALLMFQGKMRQLEMENEVMQFHTIILMLMKIERVNVEMILEWLERYSNIFREPISKCVNNYEAGAWEALEELKNEISFQQMIRIVESLQAAVEKIPIVEAFDEIDSERAYYQEKRKESNERLISKKGLIGKAIGFAPMIVLFVGYLIIPLVAIGLMSMTDTFNQMSTMM